MQVTAHRNLTVFFFFFAFIFIPFYKRKTLNNVCNEKQNKNALNNKPVIHIHTIQEQNLWENTMTT